MRLIGWDTSTKVGLLAAWEGLAAGSAGTVRSQVLDATATHSERLLLEVHELLSRMGWDLSSLDGIAVGVGPGSFTGIRIGLTTARTLGHELKISLLPFSSLRIKAQPQVDRVEPESLLMVAEDAFRGEVYYSIDRASSWESGMDGSKDTVGSPGDFVSAVDECSGEEPIFVTGNAVERFEGVKGRFAKNWENLGPEKLAAGLGEWMGRAWSEKIAQEALAVKPHYVRASHAEIKLEAGQLPKGPTRGIAASPTPGTPIGSGLNSSQKSDESE